MLVPILVNMVVDIKGEVEREILTSGRCTNKSQQMYKIKGGLEDVEIEVRLTLVEGNLIHNHAYLSYPYSSSQTLQTLSNT